MRGVKSASRQAALESSGHKASIIKGVAVILGATRVKVARDRLENDGADDHTLYS